MIGRTISHYEITEKLGEGGMGVVYKARDTRLKRLIAIKVLPPEKVADPERKRRFVQEARAASALNHPNIVTVHDIDQANGVDFIAMEYVEGKTLDGLIGRKGLKLSEALKCAIQIADALAKAHAAGIVHRDLKPGNVMVTPDGRVKVLDFGLAKLTETAPVGPEDSTVTAAPSTESGMIVGTATYMSPEQAEGKRVDARSDIFSFGSLLYEMLTGRWAFRRDNTALTLAAILHLEPPPLGPEIPCDLARTVERCLRKDPERRPQHAADIRVTLEDLREDLELGRLSAVQGPIGGFQRWRYWILTAALCLGIIAGSTLNSVWRAHPIGLVNSMLHLPREADNPLVNAQFTRLTDFPGTEADAAISPDGKFVAFLADRDGPFDIFLTQVGTGRFINLTRGSELNLRWVLRVVGFSGDGSEIWLHDADQMTPVRIMPMMGGRPRVFLRARSQNVAWSPDGMRLVYHTSDPGDPMFVADRSGGNAKQIFCGSAGVHNHFPAWSPDGRWIYFVSGNPIVNDMDLWRISSSGGTPQRMTQQSSYVAYPVAIDPATVLYVARDSRGSGPWLWALDVERKSTHRISFGLETYTSLAASADGRSLVASVAYPTANLWSVPILDRLAGEGDVRAYPLPSLRALMPRFGPRSLFYISSSGGGDGLWRYENGEALEIWKGATDPLLEPAGVSADGRRAAFVLRRNGNLRLHVETADGTDSQDLAGTLIVRGAPCWSPDGGWIVIGGNDGKGDGLFKIPTDGGAPVRIANGFAVNPVWSPDGSLIVYMGANVGNRSPVIAVRPDGTPVQWPNITAQRDGEHIRFLPDGKGLIYMPVEAQEFWMLDVATMRARRLAHLTSTAIVRAFDISPDGKQIVFDRLRDNSDIVLIKLPGRTK